MKTINKSKALSTYCTEVNTRAPFLCHRSEKIPVRKRLTGNSTPTTIAITQSSAHYTSCLDNTVSELRCLNQHELATTANVANRRGLQNPCNFSTSYVTQIVNKQTKAPNRYKHPQQASRFLTPALQQRS